MKPYPGGPSAESSSFVSRSPGWLVKLTWGLEQEAEVDLDLDLGVSSPKRPLEAEVLRELTNADLLIAEATPKGSVPSLVKKLNDKHHALARSLAGGLDNTTAGIVTGYSASRISILLNDPSFQELLAFYRQNLDVVYADMHSRMSTLSLVTLEEIATRLEDEPEKLGTAVLLDLLKTLTDRTGFGPRTTQVNVNVDLAGRLSAARRRAAEGGEGLPRALPNPPSRGLTITKDSQDVR